MPPSLISIGLVGVDGAPLRSDPPAADRVHRAALRILNGTPLCAWSTVGADGTAHANIGYFAHSDDLHLYLLSHPKSLHSRNVRANPSMAAAVFEPGQNWTDPGRGLQLFGTCRPAEGVDAGAAERVYAARFPAYVEWKETWTAGDPALEYRFYRFAPARLKLLDEAEFGDAVFVVAGIERAP